MGRSLNPSPGLPRPVQRGAAFLSGTTSVDVTINPVDPSKALLAVNGYYASAGAIGANTDSTLQWEVINATTLRFSRASATGGSPTLYFKWELKSWN